MPQRKDELLEKTARCIEDAWKTARCIEDACGKARPDSDEGALCLGVLNELAKTGLSAEPWPETQASVTTESQQPAVLAIVADGKLLVVVRKVPRLEAEHHRSVHGMLKAANLQQAILANAGKRLEMLKVIVPPFSAETVVGDIQDSFPWRAQAAFREVGIRCYDCPVGYEDDLREVARQHEMGVETLVSALNSAFGSSKSQAPNPK